MSEDQEIKAELTLQFDLARIFFAEEEEEEEVSVVVSLKDITERKRAEEDLKKRAEELEQMNKFMVGRELDMIKLKKEINALLRELGQPKKYSEVEE